jgi:predicted metal-dependent hydrolase
MTTKEFILDEQTIIKVSKRSSSRKIRLTIDPSSGQVKVSIPRWVPYKAAVDFAKSKKAWIDAQRPVAKVLEEGRQIGKNHRLIFRITDKSQQVTTRLNELEAIVFYPPILTSSDEAVQTAAKKVAKRALSLQANNLLPIRLKQLAEKYGYSYNQLTIKSLKTRWGSCDSHKNIALSLYLMQLPWELIDYVIVHELNHTEYMHHGPLFWQNMEAKLPKVKELRKQLKTYKSTI